jgi:hypothetical protein
MAITNCTYHAASVRYDLNGIPYCPDCRKMRTPEEDRRIVAQVKRLHSTLGTGIEGRSDHEATK